MLLPLGLLLTGACTGGSDQAAPTSASSAPPTASAPSTSSAPSTPAAAPPATPPGDAAGRPNILMICVDTMRADALGLYGQTEPSSPNIDRLGGEGAVWDYTWTQYTWTLPSFASFMTSRFARTHGWDYGLSRSADFHVLDHAAPTLAEVLSGVGYVTQGFNASETLRPEYELTRGFKVFQKGARPGVVRAAVADVGVWASDAAPHFTYVHLMSPHVPVAPTEKNQKLLHVDPLVDPAKGISYDHYTAAAAADKPQRRKEWWSVYLAGVRDADDDVGEILKAVADSGEAGNTYVVLLSDHGESIGEHDTMGHFGNVWEHLARVPLVLRGPGVAPAHVKDRIGRLIDVAPTLLSLLHLPAPAEWQGRSLFEGAGEVLAVTERDGLMAFTKDGRTKIIENRTDDRFMFGLDLVANPGEEKEPHINGENNPALQPLLADIAAWRAAAPRRKNEGPPVSVSDAVRAETVKQLEALGYTQH